MNIHHLELFYYVARHGGIMEAVRNIPYGIQQPAVSGQVAQLEEYLGVILFQRRPFALTPAGEKLYQFITPFFSNLEALAAELQGGTVHQFRVGASAVVLRQHLPDFLKSLRKKRPNLRITLRDGYQAELEAALVKEELDLALTVMDDKAAPGVHAAPLLEIPLVLLVEKSSGITSAEQLWEKDRIQEPLICLPAFEGISKHFQQGLAHLGVDWFPSIEVSSLDLVETYVANGFGIGVSVRVLNAAHPENVRVLPLAPSTFPPIVLGAMWKGKPTALLQSCMDELQTRAKRYKAAQREESAG